MKVKLLWAKLLIGKIQFFWAKKKFSAFWAWKAGKVRRGCYNSRIPKHLSINLSPHHSKILSESSSSRIKRPRSSRPMSQIDSPLDFGERLFKKAEELERKKEGIRKSLEMEYSFTPQISTGTPKWLQGKGKSENSKKLEDIAVVSGNSVLQFTRFTPNLKGLIENKVFVHLNNSAPRPKGMRVIAGRKDRPSIVPGFVDDILKENCSND